MPTYLLDTNAASDLFSPNRPVPPALRARFLALSGGDSVRVSAVTLCELEYGYANVDPDAPGGAVLRTAVREQIAALLEACEERDAAGGVVGTGVLPVVGEDAAVFGAAHAWLVRNRKITAKEAKKHVADGLVAAAAVRSSAVLVTNDGLLKQLASDKDSPLFGRLSVEDWGS